MLTEEQKEWLNLRIRQLSGKQRHVGPFRAEGIARTIEGMKRQLAEDRWMPPKACAERSENDGHG